MSMTKADKTNIVNTLLERNGSNSVVKKNEITQVANEYGFEKVSYAWLKNFRVDHGQYDISSMASALGISNPNTNADFTVAKPEKTSEGLTQRVMSASDSDIVPRKDPLFVKNDNYKVLEKVVKSGRFYPTFITGMSGNGKSLSVIQAAANAKRELIRINVTAGTDEEDLIGSFRLVDGETVWQDGPVTEAMKRGAIVLIDEIDMLNPNKAATLFTVLEGKGVFIKKINTLVEPTDGFNVIATANTKGKGSDDGRFMGTNVLNEAFLERFPITLTFQYPNKTQEKKIMNKVAESLEIDDADFVNNLIDWAVIIRKTFDEGAVDELISTRRLVHILNAYSIFENKEQAIRLAINRFDEETYESFWSLYTKLDADAISVDDEGNVNDSDSTEGSDDTHSF